jgi:S1-C subfamily serine protease
VISPTEILTAAHVVQAADQVWVEFTTGDTIEARVRASDQASDVALLELSRPAPTAPAVVGDSDQSKVGDEVFVVGAPLGQTHTLTVGHISARRANPFMFTSFEPVELFQTDAAINPGNSGGPMFTMGGELIGVVSHILSTTGGFQGLGYAVTSNQARATLEDPNTFSGWPPAPQRRPSASGRVSSRWRSRGRAS